MLSLLILTNLILSLMDNYYASLLDIYIGKSLLFSTSSSFIPFSLIYIFGDYISFIDFLWFWRIGDNFVGIEDTYKTFDYYMSSDLSIGGAYRILKSFSLL